MAKDEEMAEEWLKNNSYPFSDCPNIKKKLKQAFLAGLNAKTQWHDLRKDPNDLPDTDRFVYVQTINETGKAYYDDGWYSGQISGIVIAWCEEPTFKEVKNG